MNLPEINEKLGFHKKAMRDLFRQMASTNLGKMLVLIGGLANCFFWLTVFHLLLNVGLSMHGTVFLLLMMLYLKKVFF